ncbi:bifunctional adenosylcobinamide kinase/adenosylcobinamide-phosphate guanylyltransferase [Anaerolentibacter hominis]|uniref:bifunctional adenosylcobinamide kinase/adenosylcobinamide-phosphate guanylyltransferase n=1 Tax=Anaerolentibacter hominis TaxID=3079009 RepID=UPI0031B81CA2
MKLYIGGCGQNKLHYVMAECGLKEMDFCDGADCQREDLLSKKGINHLHLMVKRSVFSDRDPAETAQELQRNNPELILICDEVGCGIVPLSKEERDYRERTGRLCTELARRADEVVRIFCGIGVRIK